MYILEKIDHILGKVYESEVLTWEDVQKLCPKSTSIAAKTGDILYRGSRDYKGEYGKGLIRTDRRPLNMDIPTHNELDAAFNQIFGVKLRSASLFCTGHPRQAVQYGKVYAIYPSDDFRLYWSNRFSDLIHISQYVIEDPELDLTNADKYSRAVWLAAQVGFDLFFDDWQEGGMASWLVQNCWDFMKRYFPNAKSHKKALEDDDWFDHDNEDVDGFDDFLDFERKLSTNQKIKDEFLKAVLKNPRDAKQFENLKRDFWVKFLKRHYKEGNTESAWKEATHAPGEIMVTASFYCYKAIQ